MLSDLESLSVLKGVVAALRFHDDGTLAEAAGHLEQLDLQLAAELCYANGRIMHHGSDMLMTLSGTGGWPPRGWMMMATNCPFAQLRKWPVLSAIARRLSTKCSAAWRKRPGHKLAGA